MGAAVSPSLPRPPAAPLTGTFRFNSPSPAQQQEATPPPPRPPAAAWHTLAPFSPLRPPTASPGQGGPFTACTLSSPGPPGRAAAGPGAELEFAALGGEAPGREGSLLGQGAGQRTPRQATFARQAAVGAGGSSGRSRGGQGQGGREKGGGAKGRALAGTKTRLQPRLAARGGGGETVGSPVTPPSTGPADPRPHPGTPGLGRSYSHLKPGSRRPPFLRRRRGGPASPGPARPGPPHLTAFLAALPGLGGR